MSARAAETYRWLREYIAANASATVDEIAREADRQRRPTHKSEIARIRRELGAKPAPILRGVDTDAMEVASVVHAARGFINRARFVEVEKKPAALPQPRPTEAKEMRSGATAGDEAELKREFILARLETEPGINPTILMGDIIKEFGKGMDYRGVYELCRAARAKHGLPQIPTRVEHARETSVVVSTEPVDVIAVAVREFAEKMKASGVQLDSLVLWMDASCAVEFTYDRRLSVTGKVAP